MNRSPRNWKEFFEVDFFSSSILLPEILTHKECQSNATVTQLSLPKNGRSLLLNYFFHKVQQQALKLLRDIYIHCIINNNNNSSSWIAITFNWPEHYGF